MSSGTKSQKPVSLVLKNGDACEVTYEPLPSQNRCVYLIRMKPKPKQKEKKGFFSSVGIGMMFKTMEYDLQKKKFGFFFDPMGGKYSGGYSDEWEYQYPREEFEPTEGLATNILEGSVIPIRPSEVQVVEVDYRNGVKTLRLNEDGNIVGLVQVDGSQCGWRIGRGAVDGWSTFGISRPRRIRFSDI